MSHMFFRIDHRLTGDSGTLVANVGEQARVS
jgi:hypothetical protein